VAPDESGRWTLTGSLPRLGLPRSIREVVTGRAARLGEEAAELLSTAAVIGREFELGLLSRIVDQTEEEVLELLERAVDAALVNEGPSAGRFSFAHTLVNHARYEELGLTRRARTHRLVAEAVEEMYAADPDDQGAKLALPSISTPAFLVDSGGTLLTLNEAAGALLGVAFDEVGKMDPDEWGARFGPFDDDGDPIPLEQIPLTVALREGRPAHARFTIHNTDGEPRQIEASAMPIITKETSGAITIFWPIDESRDDRDGRR
jgi:PAS domain-containing protein